MKKVVSGIVKVHATKLINMKLKIFLVLMILSSLFMGISINGHWGSLWQFEFVDFLQMRKLSKMPFAVACWGAAVVSHIFIFILPFITRHRNFRRILWIAPIVYLLCMTMLSLLNALILIPFIVFWILSLNTSAKA